MTSAYYSNVIWSTSNSPSGRFKETASPSSHLPSPSEWGICGLGDIKFPCLLLRSDRVHTRSKDRLPVCHRGGRRSHCSAYVQLSRLKTMRGLWLLELIRLGDLLNGTCMYHELAAEDSLLQPCKRRRMPSRWLSDRVMRGPSDFAITVPLLFPPLKGGRGHRI